MFRLSKLFALVVSFCALSRPAEAGPIQIGILVDSSGSIGSSNFATMTAGLKAALLSQLPTDGSVQLTVVQFAGGSSVIVSPTLINSVATLTAAANAVGSMVFTGGSTDLAGGITTLSGQMTGSALFPTVDRSFINIVTDGVPNDQNAAILARNAALLAGIDDIDAEFINTSGLAGRDFLRDKIVSPQPGTLAPPFDPAKGFVITIDSFDDFEAAFADKISSIIRDAQIPEPTSLLLFGMAGVSGVGLYLKRRRAAA